MPPNQPVSPAKLTWDSSVDTTNPTLEGYVFKGWTVTDKTGAVVGSTGTTHLMDASYVFSVLAAGVDNAAHSKLTLTANWDLANYRIIYADGDSSTGTMSTVAPRTDATWFGNALNATTNPTKSGYTFMGWVYKDKSGANEYPATSAPYKTIAGIQGVTSDQYVGATGDSPTVGITVYATWRQNVDFKVLIKLKDANGNDAGDAAVSGWNGAALFELLKAYAAEQGFKVNLVMWAVRIALSGKAMTPAGATDILDVLGKEESLKRIRAGIEKLA